MYKNKAENGRNNISGQRISKYRQAMAEKVSQRAFADMLQLQGLDLDKNAIQRIENGKRFVTDIELKVLANVLHVSYSDLLDGDESGL